MRNGNEKSTASLDFDVALGLSTENSSLSYNSSCKRAFSSYYNPTGFPGEGGTMLNQVASGGDNNIYDQQTTGAADDDDATASTAGLPMTFLSNSTGFRPPSGGGLYGKSPYFSVSQWQELERQKIIHKYMMASMPVPPQLILPPPVSSSANYPTISQSTSSGLELRFPSSGSDPEPWRCKRTDGKKWRCSRDVAPDQKYCERHAHKSRTRSRKPVELSAHNKFFNNANKISTTSTCTNTSQSQTLVQRPITSSLFPTMASATSYSDQTRSLEWFLRGGSNANQEQWQQQQAIPTPSSTTLDFTRDMTNIEHHHNPNASSSVYDPYIPDTNFNNSQTTRHFIDAWEKEGGLDDIGNKSSNKKFSDSSYLSLSMFGNGIDEENGNDYLGIGVMNNPSPNDKDSDVEIMKQQQQPAQWMNMSSVSWMNNNSMSPPGGPLGEALCLGSSGTTRGNLASSLSSPRHHNYHGYSQNNSNNTTNSSSCSKSSCEDGNQQHALNFIG